MQGRSQAEKTRIAVPDTGLNKHQLRTEATRQKLLEAAYRIFTRDGFEAAKIEEIAREAGFTRGAFYAHFSAKNDLFLALLKDQAEKNGRKLQFILDRQHSELERAAAFRHFYVSRASDKQWAILLLEFKLYALRHPDLHRTLADAHRALRKSMNQWLVENVRKTLHWDEASCDMVRAGLEAALTGLVLERAYDPKRLSEAQARFLLGQLFDAFAKQAGP